MYLSRECVDFSCKVYAAVIAQAARILESRGALGSARNGVRDAIIAAADTRLFIKQLVGGKLFSIMCDGATTAMAGGLSVFSVSLYCAELDLPTPVIFLGMESLADCGSTADALAALIIAVLHRYDLSLKQAVSVGCDNASVNGLLCQKLNLEQLHCSAHVANRASPEVTSRLPLFEKSVTFLNSKISAGGGTKRRASLKKIGLKPNKLMVYYNRWMSALEVALYLLGIESLSTFARACLRLLQGDVSLPCRRTA